MALAWSCPILMCLFLPAVRYVLIAVPRAVWNVLWIVMMANIFFQAVSPSMIVCMKAEPSISRGVLISALLNALMAAAARTSISLFHPQQSPYLPRFLLLLLLRPLFLRKVLLTTFVLGLP